MLPCPDPLLGAGVIPDRSHQGGEAPAGTIASSAIGSPPATSMAAITVTRVANTVPSSENPGGELKDPNTPIEVLGSDQDLRTLIQIHESISTMIKDLDMSSLGGPPPGHTPPPARAGKPVSKPSPPLTASSKSSTSSENQDPHTPTLQNTGSFFGGAIRRFEKMKSAASRRSASSRSRNRKSAFFRYKIPQVVSVGTGSVSTGKAQKDSRLSPEGAVPTTPDDALANPGSRLSPDDTTVFPRNDEVETRPAQIGDDPTSPGDETTPDVSVSPRGVVPTAPDDPLTNPGDRPIPTGEGRSDPNGGQRPQPPDESVSHRGVVPTTPDDALTDPGTRPVPANEGQSDPDGGLASDATLNCSNKVPLSKRGRVRLELEQRWSDSLEARLLNPVPLVPDPIFTPDISEIEGFSSITHTSSGDATRPNGTPNTHGTPSPLNGFAPGTGECTAEAPSSPPSRLASTSVPTEEASTTQGAPESEPPPTVSTNTRKTGNPSPAPRKSGNYGLLPCNTPAEDEADSTLTAAHAEVESLVRASPGNAQATTAVPPQQYCCRRHRPLLG